MKTIYSKMLALVLILGIAFGLVGCGNSENGAQSGGNGVSSGKVETTDFRSIGSAQGMQLVAENDNIQLLIDPVSTTVGVFIKATGYLWKSNLSTSEVDTKLAEDVINRFQSQLSVTYSNNRNNVTTYNSYEHSVLKNQFEIYSMDNGVQIVYTIGESNDDFLFPEVLTEKTFDDLVAKMSEEDAEFVKEFYLFNSYDQLTADVRASFKLRYPIITSENLYVAKNASKLNKNKIIAILKELSVDEEFIKKEYTHIRFAFTEPDVASFTIPIEYTLKEDSVSVRVPMQQVTFNSSNKLNKIDVLPYFGGSLSEDGYIFIPDGSGSLVNQIGRAHV